jgi:hypothetical protein
MEVRLCRFDLIKAVAVRYAIFDLEYLYVYKKSYTYKLLKYRHFQKNILN